MTAHFRRVIYADVLAWFRGMGLGYQWEIDKALQRLMEEERRAGSR